MKFPLAPLALALVFGAACRKAEPAAGTSPAAPDASAATAAPASDAGLVTDKALLDGSLVEVSHSKWDGGRTADLFDTDPATLARTENANPAIVEIRLPNPRPLKGVSVTTGGMDAELTVSVRLQGGGAPKTSRRSF